MHQTVQLTPVTSLAPLIGSGELVAFNVGPDGIVYVVVAMRPLDYRIKSAGGSHFAKTVPDQPQKYRITGISGADLVLDITIENERFNIHDVQPLASEMLLACCRSYYRGPDDFDMNGRVYAGSGGFQREMLLGDGIATIQTTAEGVIWTSFFDEGIFGNFGWRDPVGASGLVAWDRHGLRLYEFQPEMGLDSICDCYAMNVTSNGDVWLCYYTDFPLVLLRQNKVEHIWQMPTRGSHAFAVTGEHALFTGGYKDRNFYYLYSLGADRHVVPLATLELRGLDDVPIIAGRVIGRGGSLYLMADDLLYRLDVEHAIASR